MKEYGGDVDSQMRCYTRSTVTVGYNAHAVLSILRIDLNWGGGAHPYTEEMGRTLLHTGETLGYEDLLQGTERQRREVDEQYLTGTAASDKSLRYATFYLTQTGMHFYLNVGDAVERVEVELPFTDPEDYHISAYALLSGGEAPEQFSGYAGAVQRAMERLEGYGAGEGYLYDLDGDGTEELILVYPQQSAENIPIMSYCVYTLRGGEAVALADGNDGDYYPEDSGQPLPELLERLRG